MTPDPVLPSALLASLLRRLLGRHRAEAIIGDVVEAYAQRRAAGRAPRYPRLWGNGQTVNYLVRSIAEAAPRWSRSLRFVVRDSWRALRAAPSTSAFAILVLALAIGAATVTFSVVDTVVLRQLPFERSEDLVVLGSATSSSALVAVSPAEDLAWQGHLDALDSWATVARGSESLSINGETATIQSARVTASLFEVLRTRPLLGRVFSADDEQPGREPVAVVSYELWQRLYGGTSGVIGGRLALESGPVTVLGVLPPEGAYPVRTDQSTDIWEPYVMAARERTEKSGYMTMLARLRPGGSPDVAVAQLAAATQPLVHADPGWYSDWHPSFVPLYEALVGKVRSWMLLALSAVVLLLLVACVNIANLLLTRSAYRARELAIRVALGATRRQVLFTLLVESVVLSMVAAATALVASSWGIAAAKAALPTGIARSGFIALDVRVFVVAVTAALITGLAFGAIPAWQASRADVISLLKDSAATITMARRRWRSAFVVAEVALAGMLLVATTLFVSSFVSVVRTSLGFDRSDLVAVSSALTSPVPDVARALRAVPGVGSVAELDRGSPPLVQAAGLGGGATGMWLTRADAPSGTEGLQVDFLRVSGEYFATAGIPMLRGTAFRNDTASSQSVVIDEEAARRLFGVRDPIGAYVRFSGGTSPVTVVGVVAHVRKGGPEGARGPGAAESPQAYVPLPLMGQRGATFLIRLSRPVALVRGPVQSVLTRVAPPGQRAPELTALDDAFHRLTAQRRFTASLMAIFGTLALFIGAAGVYGVMASIVAQQTRDFAVRVALGATPGQISNGIVREASRYLLRGLALGLPAAWWLSRGFAALFYGVQPTDAFVYALVAVVMLVTGLLATLPAARRAARVDPIVALKAS
jgi:putative ABC transport system permease protein